MMAPSKSENINQSRNSFKEENSVLPTRDVQGLINSHLNNIITLKLSLILSLILFLP